MTMKPRHLLHPFGTARIAFRRARMRGDRLARLVRSKRVERHERRTLPDVRRHTVDRCWCGGSLERVSQYPTYGKCDRCGGYVNTRPPVSADLERVYSLDFYWRRRQQLRGFPTIEERASLYRADGRLDRWLELVEKHAPRPGTVVEIGCAPGVLLEELRARGYTCTGVEINPEVAEWMRNNHELDVRSGYFPGVPELPRCDLFVALDVLEHSPCPDEFIREAARLLNPGGSVLIQTAIDRYDLDPPFGDRSEIFDDLEHLFLFTDKGFELMAEQAGLRVVSLDDRLWLAGEIAVLKKPAE